MTQRAAKTSAYIMTPILFGMAIVATSLVRILLTDKWLPCVPYLQIMCVVWWLQPTQSCSIQAVKAIGRSDIYLRIEVISKIIGVSLLVAAVYLFDTPLSIAITMLLGQAVAVFLYGFYVHKLIGYTIKEQLKDLFVPALLGLIMAAALYFIGFYIHNTLVCLIVQIISGAIIYVALSYIFKIEEFKYILNLILRKAGKETEQ